MLQTYAIIIHFQDNAIIDGRKYKLQLMLSMSDVIIIVLPFLKCKYEFLQEV